MLYVQAQNGANSTVVVSGANSKLAALNVVIGVDSDNSSLASLRVDAGAQVIAASQFGIGNGLGSASLGSLARSRCQGRAHSCKALVRLASVTLVVMAYLPSRVVSETMAAQARPLCRVRMQAVTRQPGILPISLWLGSAEPSIEAQARSPFPMAAWCRQDPFKLPSATCPPERSTLVRRWETPPPRPAR